MGTMVLLTSKKCAKRSLLGAARRASQGSSGVARATAYAAPFLLASCAAPPGTEASNPVCVFRCHVALQEVGNVPALVTLTQSGGAATGGDTTRTGGTTTTTTSGG